MNKMDKLFLDFPELKIIEKWIRKELQLKSEHVIGKVYKGYTLRKPKRFDEAVNYLKDSKNINGQIWADFYLNSYYWGSALLDYLNECFKELKDKKGLSGLIKNLKNSEQFFHTISELEFNSYFANRYNIRIEPKLEANGFSKKLDSGVSLYDREILFEIFTPNLSKLLENSKGATFIPNRSKSKILDKLRGQIIPVKDAINCPVVIVINASYSDIDEYDVENSILGELKITLVTETATGKMVDEYIDRGKNSVSDTEPLSDHISAIVFYKRNIRYNGISFSKKIIENPKSKFPLRAEEYKRLCRFDLRKINIKHNPTSK